MRWRTRKERDAGASNPRMGDVQASRRDCWAVKDHLEKAGGGGRDPDKASGPGGQDQPPKPRRLHERGYRRRRSKPRCPDGVAWLRTDVETQARICWRTRRPCTPKTMEANPQS